MGKKGILLLPASVGIKLRFYPGTTLQLLRNTGGMSMLCLCKITLRYVQVEFKENLYRVENLRLRTRGQEMVCNTPI